VSRTLTLPLPPSANNLYVNARGRGRILSKAGREYKQAVRILAMGARLPLLRGDVVLTMTVYFPNRRRRDLDNTLKVCQDSLTGVAYADDSQVCELHLYREYDSGNPRAEVSVRAATDSARAA
jgi:crossover junction endodeoxyribonuclease RusA